MTEMKFSDLIGKTLVAARNENDERIVFETSDESFALLHHQDCCESVHVESITGDLTDLIGAPILLAEEAQSNDRPIDVKPDEYTESETWTFYKLRTIKGSVDIRWHGTSNGYYSESVDFVKL